MVDKWQYLFDDKGMVNDNIYFENNFNRLVMNITQIIFFLTKCAYMMLN